MLESIDSPHDPNVTVDVVFPEIDVRIWREEALAILRLQQRRELLSKVAEWPLVNRARDIAKCVLRVDTK